MEQEKFMAHIKSNKPNQVEIILPDGSDLCKKVGVMGIDLHMDMESNTAKILIETLPHSVHAETLCYVHLGGTGAMTEISGFIDKDGNQILIKDITHDEITVEVE